MKKWVLEKMGKGRRWRNRFWKKWEKEEEENEKDEEMGFGKKWEKEEDGEMGFWKKWETRKNEGYFGNLLEIHPKITTVPKFHFFFNGLNSSGTKRARKKC